METGRKKHSSPVLCIRQLDQRTQDNAAINPVTIEMHPNKARDKVLIAVANPHLPGITLRPQQLVLIPGETKGQIELHRYIDT